MKQLNPYFDAIDTIGGAIDRAVLVAVDAHAPDVLLARLAEAHAGVIRADMMLHAIDTPSADATIVHNDRLPNGAKPKTLDLPKLQRQPKDKAHPNVERPGITKLTKGAKDFDCPTCGAVKGTNCFKFTSPGGRPTEERREDGAWMHNKRQQAARDYNNRIKAKYDREHFEAKS